MKGCDNESSEARHYHQSPQMVSRSIAMTTRSNLQKTITPP
ncbi:hypothetical protein [Geminocystis sp. NIES-3709]|nr:hypothetical protein [Geminocystis sp. NIES-3709]